MGGSSTQMVVPSGLPGLPNAVRPLTDSEFARFRQLIEREIGIHLSEAKRPLLLSRLGRRLRQLGIGTFGEYFDLIGADVHERGSMLDALCTN